MKKLNEYLNEGLIRRQAGIDMKAKIEQWLNEHRVVGYIINDDLTIDTLGSVSLSGYKEKQLPDYIQFSKVFGYFECSNCKNLESLKGCPKEFCKIFSCENCPKLKSLEGAPQEVDGYFDCSGCDNLTSLTGAPQEVGGTFFCTRCGEKFTEDDVKKLCKVKGRIIV